MINVLALTQFAFLSLGIVSLKILIQANGRAASSTYLQQLDAVALWLFVVPLLWVAFASVCQHVNRGPLRPTIARIVGVVVAVLCFLFLATVTFFPGTQ